MDTCNWYIHNRVSLKDGSLLSYITWYCALCNFFEKVKLWQALIHLSRTVLYPWLCIGDLNEILYDSEKEGGDMRERR